MRVSKWVLTLILALPITLSAQPHPHRIISMSPAITEILFALEAGPQVVGVTRFCNYPEQAKSLPRCGDALHPKAEKIITLRPDLIITQAENKGISLGLPPKTKILAIPQAHSIQDIHTNIQLIGNKTGHAAQAQALIKKLKAQSQSHLQSKSPNKNPKVLVLIWAPPMMSAGSHTYIMDSIRQMGGQDAIPSTQDYPSISTERLLISNPDIIFVTEPRLLRYLKTLPGLSKTTAYKTHHIHLLTPDFVSRPGPRYPQALAEIRRYWP